MSLSKTNSVFIIYEAVFLLIMLLMISKTQKNKNVCSYELIIIQTG